MPIKVSVIIPAYNEEKYLSICLKSLQKQTVSQKDFEVIVVDNNSSDKTAIVAKKFPVKVILEKRQGIIYARQAGTMKAKGEILAYTDADTFVAPDWIEQIITGFVNNPTAICVDGPVYFFEKGRLTPKIYNQLVKLLGKSPKVPDFYFNGANFAILAKTFHQAGGFDLKFGGIANESHLIKKVYKYGTLKYNPNMAVISSTRRFEKNGYVKTLLSYFLMESSSVMDFPLISKFVSVQKPRD